MPLHELMQPLESSPHSKNPTVLMDSARTTVLSKGASERLGKIGGRKRRRVGERVGERLLFGSHVARYQKSKFEGSALTAGLGECGTNYRLRQRPGPNGDGPKVIFRKSDLSGPIPFGESFVVHLGNPGEIVKNLPRQFGLLACAARPRPACNL